MNRRLLALVVMLAPTPALAAWASDPSLNTPIAATSSQPAVVADGSDGVFVGWRNHATHSYFVQHLTAGGDAATGWPAAGRAVAPDNSEYDSQLPDLVLDGNGGVFVGWIAAKAGNTKVASVQHVLASGALDPTWPADGVTVSGAGDWAATRAMTGDGSGGVLVVFARSANGIQAVYAQHLRANGTVDPAWPPDGRAVTPIDGIREAQAIVGDDSGGALVASCGPANHVYVQHVLATGAIDPVWPAAGLYIADRAYGIVKAVTDHAGGAVYAWNGPDPPGVAQLAQRVRASGVIDPDWPAGGKYLTYGVAAPIWFVSDGAGGILHGYGPASLQHVRGDGTIAWSRSVSSGAGPKGVVSDGAGGAIVLTSGTAIGTELWAQHVLADGDIDPAWPATGRAMSTNGDAKLDLAMADDGAGGAVAVWMDNHANGQANGDIVGQNVHADGTIGSSYVSVPEGAASALALASPSPNPSRASEVLVRFQLAEAGPATLELFDVSGRRVAWREVGAMGPGAHALRLDEAARLAPGIFLVRLSQGNEQRSVRGIVLR